MDNRRKTERRRTYLGGLIAFNHRYSTLECVVRNLSWSGALIAMPSTKILPGTFEITINKTGEQHAARTIWLTETSAGIQFERAPNVLSFEAARRFKALDQERRMLTRRIDDWTSP